ncbi:MAG: arsenate reductase ArsC [Acidobacteriia bacterium]|nr:arsenate reductase ArsC [Terriglobia bacterium]
MNAEKKRVLFVCLGNACRSQMAEGFARKYGGDVLVAASAGLTPAMHVAPDTLRAMGEKNIDLRDHFPKGIRLLGRARFDLAINMSGLSIPEDLAAHEDEWDVPDPVFMKYKDHCGVRDQIERLVMNLILQLRKEQSSPHFRGQGSHLPRP